MSNSQDATLALHGGKPVIASPLAPFHSVGEEEAQAAAERGARWRAVGLHRRSRRVLHGWPQGTRAGGPGGRLFRRASCVAVNSWTSGLIASVGAIGIEPGDEVITTPWTMAATATAILHWAGDPGVRRHRPRQPSTSTRPASSVWSRRARARSWRSTSSASRAKWRHCVRSPIGTG